MKLLINILFLSLLNNAVIAYGYDDSSKLHKLFSIVRCPSCMGQSILESDSDIAIKMRTEITFMIKQNMEEKEILDYIRNKYGEHSVFEPDFNTKHSLLIWAFPFILLSVFIFLMAKILIINPRNNVRTIRQKNN